MIRSSLNMFDWSAAQPLVSCRGQFKPYTATNKVYGNCYGGYMHPWYLTDQSISLVMSQWGNESTNTGDYNAFVLEIPFTSNVPYTVPQP